MAGRRAADTSLVATLTLSLLLLIGSMKPAHAHNEEVIFYVVDPFLTYLFGFIALIKLKTPKQRKLLALGLMFSGIVIEYLTFRIPYLQNEALVGIINIICPLLLVVLGIWIQISESERRAFRIYLIAAVSTLIVLSLIISLSNVGRAFTVRLVESSAAAYFLLCFFPLFIYLIINFTYLIIKVLKFLLGFIFKTPQSP